MLVKCRRNVCEKLLLNIHGCSLCKLIARSVFVGHTTRSKHVGSDFFLVRVLTNPETNGEILLAVNVDLPMLLGIYWEEQHGDTVLVTIPWERLQLVRLLRQILDYLQFKYSKCCILNIIEDKNLQCLK